MAKINQMIPMLNVRDIQASLQFYENALGFKMASPREALDEWKWCSIVNGDIHLMLAASIEGDPPFNSHADPNSGNWPAIYYWYPDNVVELHGELEAKGYAVSNLYVTFYGMKEFWLHDPDGHLLTFGESTDEPVSEHC